MCISRTRLRSTSISAHAGNNGPSRKVQGLEYAGFYWGNKPTRFDKTLMELYAIRSNRQGVPPLSGDVINDAYQSYDEHSQPAVSMSMDATGASIWAKMTEERKNDPTGNNFIAIVLSKNVYSAPGVKSVITGGRSEIWDSSMSRKQKTWLTS